MFLLYRFSLPRPRSTVREREKPSPGAPPLPHIVPRPGPGTLPPSLPSSPKKSSGQPGSGAPWSHNWLSGRARVTETLIHQRSCHHNNRSEGILATAGGEGRGRRRPERRPEETHHRGSGQHSPRAAEPRSMQTARR